MKNGIGKYNKHYYTGNHLSSTQLVTDGTGEAVQQVEYALFGEVVNEYNIDWSNGQVPDFKFNAKELDEENGLYYFEARYQNPPVFISRDPLFEKYPTLSPYSYCANNPLKYIDPTGMIIDPAGAEEAAAYQEYKDKINAEVQNWQNKVNTQQTAVSEAKNGVQKFFRQLGLKFAKSQLNMWQGIQNELCEMESSETIFKICMGNNIAQQSNDPNICGSTTYDVSLKQVNINVGGTGIYSTMQVLSHELLHGYHYLNGELDFDCSGLSGGMFYDKTDEYAAYNRQNLFATDPKQLLNPIRHVNANYPRLPNNNVSYKNWINKDSYDKDKATGKFR
ncbi:MAG: RHS repeat-associated core domain-containing protein [Bacteroidales bacterium]|jgi:RHS repeat-associated protein|nr:RHS repeat-associated core domain-containing protein [Bacteroidales bacterium]